MTQGHILPHTGVQAITNAITVNPTKYNQYPTEKKEEALFIL